MPAISKIRFTNVVYEDGNKRYNDEVFQFDGHNGAILLENGGGKTVFIQTALQAVLPHSDLAGRKLKETFSLENGPAHVAIEWILHERPRRYAVTCVTLFLSASGLDSIRYAYDYAAHDADAIDEIPFVRSVGGKTRPAEKGEIQDYYQSMTAKRMNAHTFPTIKSFHQYLEEQLHIIAAEWEWIAKINQTEGGIEHFFDECKTTTLLFDRLLIPVVEDAMSGYSDGKFAEVFETHRESFKRYKELKEKVEENERILTELDTYVAVYEKLNDKQLTYASQQSEAKAYWRTAHEQDDAQRDEFMQLEQQIQQWTNRKEQLQRQKDSLLIAKERQELEASRQLAELAGDDKRSIDEQIEKAEQQYYSIRYADYRTQSLEAEEMRRSAEEQLQQLGQSEDERELEEAWVSNNGQLRYVLDGLEEQWNAQKRRLEQTSEALGVKLSLEEQRMAELGAELRALEDQSLGFIASEKEKESQREDIRKEVLANPAMEKVKDKLVYWIARQQELDDSNVALAQRNREIVKRKGVQQEQAAQINTAIRTEVESLGGLEAGLASQQQAHQAVLAELSKLRPAWEKLQSVYDRQNSIERQLEEDAERLLSDKERLLQQERLTFRFVDDYAGQDRFFADSFIANLIRKWSNQFAVLTTGIEYMEHVPSAEKEQISSLWALTLVTLEADKSALRTKLSAYAEQLQYPIRVISTEEAARLAKGEDLDPVQLWIEPGHWTGNAEHTSFAQWQQEVMQTAERSRQERIGQEEKLTGWNDAKKLFSRFITQFPLEQVQQLETLATAAKEKVRQLEREAEQLQALLEQDEAVLAQNMKKIEAQKDEYNQLSQWLAQAQKYMKLGKEIAELCKLLAGITEQRTALGRRTALRQREYNTLKEQQAELNRELQQTEQELTSLRAQELYAEVSGFPPLATELRLERLKEEHRRLSLRRLQISESRGELEVKLQAAKSRKGMLKNEMARLQSERSDLLLELSFPVNGKVRLEELLGDVQRYKEKQKRLAVEYEQSQRTFTRLEEKVKLLLERYANEHKSEPPLMFHEALSAVAERLEAVETMLSTEKRDLDRLGKLLHSQLEDIQDAIKELVPYKLLHGFENPHIVAIDLTAEANSDFSYNRVKTVKAVTERLASSYLAVEAENERLTKARDRFKAFGRRHINDVKLREMAEQGVEQAASYGDIVSFHETMQNRIHRANHIAEETMRTHNQQLEQYIVHVHSHLKQVTLELKDIPNKTRVKIDNEWKPIYSFSIPEWEEQDGKGAIRQYLDWITTQLENEKYQNDQGQAQEAAVKKDLGKWLDTKQLLQVILQDKAMKVTCRKVTNENTLTRAAYSWEQSNNWSGGEKWSKNMTLFLGLLNYTAEKRQHIQAGMKRHRAVILDNPFGKASSDHVLSPVFFIAEQLGFQIIALTAHAAGKFLQDYFPIVFSCRLRQAAGIGKQIMTKEKTINQAYFRDHAPLSMERLGDVTQVELF